MDSQEESKQMLSSSVEIVEPNAEALKIKLTAAEEIKENVE